MDKSRMNYEKYYGVEGIGNSAKVKFKSNNSFYFKEKDGTKNNTVKLEENCDVRFNILDEYIKGKWNRLVVQIHLVGQKHELFQRIVKDVSFYEGIYIITWEDHKNKK
jgi:hypothetical protein